MTQQHKPEADLNPRAAIRAATDPKPPHEPNQDPDYKRPPPAPPQTPNPAPEPKRAA